MRTKMTGYDPIPLRRLMKKRLYYFCRARAVKGEKKEEYKSLLTKEEEKIRFFLKNNQVEAKFKNKALETIRTEAEL